MTLDLSTTYLGLALKNPLVISASPLTTHLHTLIRLEEAGAAAAILSSLFQEQIQSSASDLLPRAGEAPLYTEAPLFVEDSPCAAELDEYNTGADGYLRQIEAVRRTVKIPIIASLNGSSAGDWVRFSKSIQDAGADALELNIYFVPTRPSISGSQVEDRYVELVSAVRSEITIPLSLKIGPYFSSLPHFADRLAAAGINGLVLFNRFLQPDIDIMSLEVSPRLVLSSRDELRLPLRWIAILRDQLSISLAGTSGVHFAEDMIKLLLAGADVVMSASALIRHGPSHARTLLDELEHWMIAKGFRSVADFRGILSQGRCQNPEQFERANYTRALTLFSRRGQ